MSELRRDPISDSWVIIAPDRAARPLDFPIAPPRPSAQATCPFCPGREHETPPEIASIRDAKGWRVRVVPNKFPALVREGAPGNHIEGLLESGAALGAHEVIIEGPEHVLSLTGLPAERIPEILATWRSRLLDLKRDARLAFGLVFKNVGERAGASLEHVHSQLIAAPVVPVRVQAELERCARHHEETGRCLLCDLIAQERKGGARVVAETSRFIVLAPWASKAPFETHILPKDHASHFEATDDAGIGELAETLRKTLVRIERALDGPAYNVLVCSGPLNVPASDSYHWRLEIIPRVAGVAGFEWATGFFINTVAPEAAAARLRQSRV
ncbi:MAG TPA: galactose-1-phosphate uridylyltransferase [Planctomycetota bacterium]|nr:galactose-1-phosphate uridylyltransferase [Planctomycetota bacterium]